MDKAEITLDITEAELQQLNARLRADHDPNKQAVDFSRKSLHRVFLDRSLKKGGRFYGAWYQNIPSKCRERILIDGAPVLEPDFSGYHPRILYALKGLPLPEDPYFLKDYPQTDELRKFLKTLLLSIVNAKDKKDAIGGMRGARFDEHKKAYWKGIKLQPLGIEPLTDQKYLEIMNKLTDRHKPIEEYFYSDSGTYLQYIDSQIAEYIMLYFADMGHPCLPMHDSFIVDARLESKLRWVMEEVFRQGLNQEIGIKHNMDQLFYRLAFRLKDDWKSGKIDNDRREEIENGLRETMQEVEKELAELEAQADIDPDQT
jgi:hypothetical protein